jgi:hypothetical protein
MYAPVGYNQPMMMPPMIQPVMVQPMIQPVMVQPVIQQPVIYNTPGYMPIQNGYNHMPPPPPPQYPHQYSNKPTVIKIDRDNTRTPCQFCGIDL